MIIAQTNKLRLPVYLTNTEPHAYGHLSKFKDIAYEIINSTYKHISRNILCS
jgi:hypothetical protein